jgi:hypothetical protein
MIRPLLSLERLSLDEKEGKVCYRYGQGPKEQERMDYLEFIARVTSLFTLSLLFAIIIFARP